MRSTGRVLGLCAVVSACATVALQAPAALGANFGIKEWEAGTCTEKGCEASTPEQFYTQAAGHPPFGITDFALNTNATTGAPEGKIKEVRVDIPPGLSVNPFAVPYCKLTELESIAGCPEKTQVGEAKLKVHVLAIIPAEVSAPVYNMQPRAGAPLEADFEPIPGEIVHIVGGIDWSGDYHEFFTIKEIPNGLAELVESRLIFFGTSLSGGDLPFITMPSACSGPQTTYLKVASYEGAEEAKSFTTGPPDLATPIGATGCEAVPFKPEINVTPSTTQSDRPDAAAIEVKVPQIADSKSIDSSTLKDAHVTLPEGMTLNPAAASGLEACTNAEFGKGTTSSIKCPAGSQVGTDTIETPDLPAKVLTGNVYVGEPLSTNPESGQEYRIFIDAEAPNYGVSVRLEGRVSANAGTGQLTTAVLENPQVPFSDFIVSLGGPRTPLANPLVCGAATSRASSLLPYSGNPAANPFISFPIDFDGKGGTCPSPLPFALTQSASSAPATAGSATGFTLSLARNDGNQYLSKVSVTLPPGLVGKIPTVTLCGEPQAALGTCPAASEIGTATVSAGAGPSPLTLSGPVYLTGPYGGAPFGLSVAVPANNIGPYSYGTIVTRASISIDPYTARVTITSSIPTMVGGVPLRLRTVTVSTNRPGFMLNPTNCGVLATNTTLTSTFGATQALSTPFQASGCDALPFNPKFSVSSDARTSRRNGASLVVKLSYPAGAAANIASVSTQLPKQLVARLSTLNHACPEATFNANPAACPAASRVGGARAATPVLPGKLMGSTYFVSHGGAAFPDLDVVLSGSGVTVILVGHTNISGGITTSTFAALPDVPVSSFILWLPTGSFSALTANGNLCAPKRLIRQRKRITRRVHGRLVHVFRTIRRLRAVPLVMPTIITAQNGKVIRQRTKISVSHCPRTLHRKRHRTRRRSRRHHSRHRR